MIGGLDYHRTLYGINEPVPGPRWQALFDSTWPAYRAWFLGGDREPRTDLATAVRMLARHMPELLPTYQRLVELAGGDEVAARMLTMWNLPRFSPGCSQLAVAGPEPMLCRNYDYSPDLFEYTVVSSRFTGRRVLGTGDCLWGLLDGMNDAGLALSLAFGGRPGSGRGFAIPLVLRYLLEVCTDTDDVRAALRGLPVAMSYNVTVVDAAGNTLTAYLDPGEPAELSTAAAGHQPPRRRCPSSPRRPARCTASSAGPHCWRSPPGHRGRPSWSRRSWVLPLYNTGFSRAFGTLYTALYQPTAGTWTTAGRAGPGGGTSTTPTRPRRSPCTRPSAPGSAEPPAPAPFARTARSRPGFPRERRPRIVAGRAHPTSRACTVISCGSLSASSIPKLITRCGWMRMSSRSGTTSAAPRISRQRTRHGSRERRSSTTKATRPLSATLRYLRLRVIRYPPMSIVPSSAL